MSAADAAARARRIPTPVLWLLITVLHIAAGSVGQVFATLDSNVSSIWPPAGVALTMTLVFGSRVWPAVAAGALVLALGSGFSVLGATGASAAAVLEALFGAYMIHSVIGTDSILARVQGVYVFFGAGFLAALSGASVGTVGLALAEEVTSIDLPVVWGTWLGGDLIAILVIVPFLYAWSRAGHVNMRGLIEGAVLFILLALATGIVFGPYLRPGDAAYPLAFTVPPMLVWASYRLGPRGATLTTFLIAVVAITGTLNGFGPFARASLHESLLLLQVFIAVCVLTALPLSVALAERKRTEEARRQMEQALHAAREELEQRVEERTADLLEVNQRLQQEVAERRRAEQKLALHARQTPLAVIEWDLQCRVVEWNPAAEEMFGYGRHEALGMHMNDLLPELERHASRALCESLVASAGSSRRLSENLTKDGRAIQCEWYYTSLVDEENSIIGIASMSLDVSNRVRAECELVKARDAAELASRAKSDFLATMSHELRTPLHAVLGMTELMLVSESLSLEQRNSLQTIYRSGNDLLVLINDLLDVSRIEAGGLPLLSVQFDLERILSEVAERFSAKAQDKSLALFVQSPAELPQPLQGDPGRLRQVLSNLVDNAIKFTSSGSVRLSVKGDRVEHGKQTIHFSVEDTGIGIREDQQALMFERFTQADSTSTRVHGGIGLGLAISRQLVEMMGGALSVSSRLGEGSTFFFSLSFPVCEHFGPQASAAPPIRVQITGTAGTERPRFLVVEDNRLNQFTFRSMLEELGGSVEIAENGREAVERFDGGFDMVFMDISMPEMDGFEATREIRRREAGKERVPIIGVTAHAMSGDCGRCLEAGMDDYLSKPVRLQDLKAVIEAWCARPIADLAPFS